MSDVLPEKLLTRDSEGLKKKKDWKIPSFFLRRRAIKRTTLFRKFFTCHAYATRGKNSSHISVSQLHYVTNVNVFWFRN